jgi:uncharacterized protein
MTQQPFPIRISSGGVALAGTFYPGTGSASFCIVMAHGFGLPAAAGLGRYAELFAEAGYRVLVFDYRSFGASEGEPRQLLDVRMQLEDWAAAVAHARRLPGVDPDRIVLWGTSFSGGHVVVTAARDRRVAAVISQIPFMDGLAMIPVLGAGGLLRLTLPILRDIARRVTGRAPYYVPIAATPGEVAALPVEGAAAGYRQLLGDTNNGGFAIAPRALLTLPLYRPILEAAKVACPLLIQIAENDSITPPKAAERAAKLAKQGMLQRFPANHFDFYSGATFLTTSQKQLAFLQSVTSGQPFQSTTGRLGDG